jgi:hypothetical protein
MNKPVATKMGIKSGMRSRIINAPSGVMKNIGLPSLNMASKLAGDMDYIHFFANRASELNRKFHHLARHLKAGGALWISWPKGGQEGTDLTLPSVIRIGYDHGLVESKTLSIDATWSAIKFTHPKKGKIYKNSYGKLK